MYSTDKLRKLRKEKKITLKQMADVLNTSISYYHMLELNKRKLHYDEAVKIAKYFNMKPDDLFLK